MTTPVAALDDPNRRIMRAAQRAWFRAGVRRRDRRQLSTDLGLELAAAAVEGSSTDVLGADPAAAARAWAQARRLTDRRLRLALFATPAVLAGIVAAGVLLGVLADAFHDDGNSVLYGAPPAVLLALYAGAGLLAGVAIVLVASQLLHAAGDTTARATVRALAIALLFGAVAAVVAGVLVARADGFAVDTETFIEVCASVLAVVGATIGAARWVAVRNAHH